MFKTLLKINLKHLFHSMFSGGKLGKGSKSMPKKGAVAVLLVFVAVSITASAGMMLYSFAQAFCTVAEMRWFYFALIGILVFLFTFIGSVFTTQNLIFKAKDNELLLSMPVPAFYILASRLTVLFVLDLIYAAIIAIPAAVDYFLVCGFSAVTLLMFAVGIFLIIVLSSAVTCFFGWLIAIISSKLKSSNLFQTVFSLLFFGAYMVVCFNLQGYMQQLLSNGEAIAAAVKKSVPMFYSFGIACSEHDVLQLLLLAVIAFIPFALVCLLISKSFIKITTARKSAKKTKYVEKELKISSAKAALFKKELKRFATLPIYILNCGTGIIMSLLFAVLSLVQGNELTTGFAAAGMTEVLDFIPFIVCIAIGFCSVMTNSCACSISLEGSRINTLRSMPVSADDFYFSKLAASAVIGMPAALLSSILASAGFGLSALQTVLVCTACLSHHLVSTFINLLSNTLMPRFSWNSEAVIIKQSGSVLIGMLSGTVCTAAVIGPAFALSKYICVEWCLAIITAVCLALCAAFTAFFKTSGRKRFENMYA